MGSCGKSPSGCILSADEQFRQLRPSKELLYYRRKLQAVAKELQGLQEEVERCKESCDREHQLEGELQRSRADVRALQDAISDIQVFLYHEREQTLRAAAENDRLKARSLQDRRKIAYLLALTGTSDKEATVVSARPWKDTVLQRPAPVRVTGAQAQNNRKKASKAGGAGGGGGGNRGPWPRTVELLGEVESLKAENEALRKQLEAQEELWKEHLHTLTKDRELLQKEAALAQDQTEEKISSLSRRLAEVQEQLCACVKEALAKEERRCLEEVSAGSRKGVRVLDGLTITSPVKVHGRGASSEKHAGTECVKVLKEELHQREQLVKMYQEQCVLQERQLNYLQQQLDSVRRQLSERNQKLVDVVALLKARYAQLDQRRRLESEGFRSDVRLLRQRLTEVERSMLKVARAANTAEYADADLLCSAADTLNKAEMLGKELIAIKRKNKRAAKWRERLCRLRRKKEM